MIRDRVIFMHGIVEINLASWASKEGRGGASC